MYFYSSITLSDGNCKFVSYLNTLLVTIKQTLNILHLNHERNKKVEASYKEDEK